MLPKRILLTITAILLSRGIPSSAQAPGPDEGMVTGTGTVVLRRAPDTLRLKVEVFARGKTVKEALAALKERRAAIRAQLGALGATDESIRFADPQINSAVLDRQRQMELMIRSRMAQKPAARKDAPAPPVVVSANLTAEWPLKGEGVEEWLVVAATLEAKVKAADLPGKKDLEKPSVEDEELREEMAGIEPNADPNDPTARQGEPAFLFVSKLSDADRASALADAFARARAGAEAMARAAGATLGPLRRLQGGPQSGEQFEDPAQIQADYLRALRGGGGQVDPADEPESALEAVGASPGAVSYRVRLSAAFALK